MNYSDLIRKDSIRDFLCQKEANSMSLAMALLPPCSFSISILGRGKLLSREYRHPLYTTDDTSLQWELAPGTKKVLGYTCQKAAVRYLGRNYIAWFAPALPISSGPWKLRGLPGLILEVSYERGEYQFDAVLIEEKPKDPALIPFVKDRYSMTTRQKVNETLRRIHKDVLQAIQTIYGRRPQVVGSDATIIPVPYNPIELE